MKKLILTILLTLVICSPAWADHWVYIRLEDRVGPTKEATAERSKRGDIVDIREVNPQNVPTAKEKSEYMILKVSGLTGNDIELWKEVWREQKGIQPSGSPIYETKAYRKKLVDVNNLGIVAKKGEATLTLSKTIVGTVTRDKTEGDLAKYDFKTKMYAMSRPFKIAWLWYDRRAFAETISTINKSGEDYNTVTLWEDAKDGDLVAETRQETGELYDDDGNLTDNPTIDGVTTNATYFMKLTSPVGERHNGTVSQGAKIIKTNASILTVNGNYTVIEWIIFEVTADTAGAVDDVDVIKSLGQTGVVIKNNMVHLVLVDAGSGSDRWRGIRVGISADTTAEYYILNNIVYGFNDGGASGNSWDGVVLEFGLNFFETKTVYLYNNTIYNSTDSGMFFDVRNSATTGYVVNNLSVGNGTDFVFDADMTVGANDYNASSDSSATGSNSLNTASTSDFVSVTAGSEDLHLVSVAVEINEGDDLGTTQGVNFDIDNRDRDAQGDVWDIGADEFVAAATGTQYLLNNAVFGNAVFQ
jgi:hypothetical protein